MFWFRDNTATDLRKLQQSKLHYDAETKKAHSALLAALRAPRPVRKEVVSLLNMYHENLKKRNDCEKLYRNMRDKQRHTKEKELDTQRYDVVKRLGAHFAQDDPDKELHRMFEEKKLLGDDEDDDDEPDLEANMGMFTDDDRRRLESILRSSS